MITSGTIAKFTISTILGIITAHFWSIGEQRIAIFILGAIIFHIFFIVGEEKPKKIIPEEFSKMFAKEMKKYKNSNLFNK